jgi:hypothetical protein
VLSLDKLGVTGSSPVPPTLEVPVIRGWKFASTKEVELPPPLVPASIRPQMEDATFVTLCATV